MAPLKQSDRKKKRCDEKKKKQKQKLIIGESDKKKQRSKEKKKKLIIGEPDKGKKKQSDKKEKSWKMKMCEEEQKKRSDMEMIEVRKRIEEERKALHWDLFEAGFLPSGPPGGPPAALRRSWPELVGLTGEEAKAKIKEEKPELKMVEVVPEPGLVTCDYRLDRVRIFIDSDGKVDRAPTHGIQTLEVAYTIEEAHSARVKGPYMVASASSDGVIRVWDVRMATTFPTHLPCRVHLPRLKTTSEGRKHC